MTTVGKSFFKFIIGALVLISLIIMIVFKDELIVRYYAWTNDSSFCNTNNWHEYSNEGGKFRILMPCIPTQKQETVEGIASHTISSITKSKDMYAVIYLKLPEEANNLDDSQVEQLLYEVRKSITGMQEFDVKMYKKLLIESPQGFPGREFFFEVNGDQGLFSGEQYMFMQMFLIADRLYMIAVDTLSDRKKPSSEDIKFFKSFNVAYQMKQIEETAVNDIDITPPSSTEVDDAGLAEILRQREEEDTLRQQADAEKEKERHKRMKEAADSFVSGAEDVDRF